MKCKCKKEFTPKKRNGVNVSKLCDTCFRKKEREKAHKAREREKLRKAKKREKKRETNKYWGAKCWKLFSAILKAQSADWYGNARCYTCDAYKPISELQAGHCFHRGRGGWRRIDFWAKHIHLQCQRCNLVEGGALPIFTAKLIKAHGWEFYEKLRKGAVEPAMTVQELKDLHDKLSRLQG